MKAPWVTTRCQPFTSGLLWRTDKSNSQNPYEQHFDPNAKKKHNNNKVNHGRTYRFIKFFLKSSLHLTAAALTGLPGATITPQFGLNTNP